MSKLIILMGLPGSGKTTFSGNFPGVSIHIDEIRKAVTGSYKPNDSNDLVHQVSQKSVYYHLEKGKNVILDGALLSKKTRAPFIKIAQKLHSEVEIYWLDPSFDVIKQRLYERNKTVSAERKIDLQYIDKLSQMLDIPSLQEGFIKIHHVSDSELL